MDAHAKQDQFRGDTDAKRAAWLRQILSDSLADELIENMISADRTESRRRKWLCVPATKHNCCMSGWGNNSHANHSTTNTVTEKRNPYRNP